MRYRNCSNATRVWPALTNTATGTTLILAPGESADVDATVHDPALTPEPDPTPDPEPVPADPGEGADEPPKSRKRGVHTEHAKD